MQEREEPESRLPADLRGRAEERLRLLQGEQELDQAMIDAKALVHELQVHQIELQMQNEELLRAKAETEEALDRYTDLFDFAPIGYFTLDDEGRILEANLAGADLLGTPRSELVHTDFRFYLTGESMPAFEDCLGRVCESSQKHACELQLRRGKQPGPYVRVEGAIARGCEDGRTLCRVVVNDITERKRAQEMLQAAHDGLEVRVRERTAELAEARGESERHAAELQSFLSSMADGVLMVDPSGDVLYANDAALEILQVPPDESFGNWLTEYRRYTIGGDLLPAQDAPAAQALSGEIAKDNRVKIATPWRKERLVSISASPVRGAEERVIGAIVVFRDIREQVEFERLQRELLEREHHIAEVLQQALVPPEREYSFECCRIAVDYLPASSEAEIGGDFYDVFQMENNRLGIVIGDITGKGLSAAIRVAAARHSIRSYAYIDPDPGAVMTLVNDALCREGKDVDMLTCFFGVLDPNTGTIAFTSAGHEGPFLRHLDGNVTEPSSAGRALGLMCGYSYSASTLQLQPGDALVVVTDGITEAMCTERQFFGREGIREFLKQASLGPPDEIAAGLLETAKQHAQGKLRDDAAVLVTLYQP